MENTRSVLFKGNPLTLVGRALREGSSAPDFRAIAGDLSEFRFADRAPGTAVITSFPSIDTPVCDLQVKEFNKRAAALPGTALIGVSMDLPFAQKRFCEANGISNVTVVSDQRFSSFGLNYGLLIRQLNLLARAVIVVDAGGTIRYLEIVRETTSQPDYNAAVAAIAGIASGTARVAAVPPPARCAPCESGAASLPKDTISRLLAQHRGWELVDGRKIVKEFRFPDFAEARSFLDLIASIADEQGHHPSLTLTYGRLRVSLTTHAAGGLTDNDFVMARVIDELQGYPV